MDCLHDAGMGIDVTDLLLLCVMMTFFAILALDIAFPALVLCVFASLRWLVINGLPQAPASWRLA